MNFRFRTLASTAFVCALLVACGSSSDGDGDDDGSSGSNGSNSAIGSGTNRSGPESLSGFAWTSEPQTVNGITLQLSFKFDDTSVTATNTCNSESTATVSSPVRYHYTADILEDSDEKTVDGDNDCSVSISKSKMAFELVGNKLKASSGDEVIEFESSGTHAGVYGEWKASGNGLTLKWQMKDGKIRATAECDNGLSATTESDANYANFFDIAEGVEKTNDDGLECSVSIAKGTFKYRFEDDALLLGDAQGNNEVRFESK